jgi:hypothetical protein
MYGEIDDLSKTEFEVKFDEYKSEELRKDII